MTDEQLKQIQQELFFKLGVGKIDLHHFESVREIVVVKENEPLLPQNILHIFQY
jgi:hypothetical protein